MKPSCCFIRLHPLFYNREGGIIEANVKTRIENMDHIVQASVRWQEKLILLVVGCDLERRFDWIVTAEWRSSQFFSDHVFPRHYWLFPVKTEENVVQHFWLVVSVDFQACLNWLKAGAHFYKILFRVSENPATLVFNKNWNCRGEEVEKATYFL